MPHWLILPARPVALISWRKDQCRWWTLTPHTTASPLFAYFCLYMSQYLGDLRRGGGKEGCMCVCVLLRCCRSTLSHAGGAGGLKRWGRHLPDCWNVNAVALIIGFCTHRLWGTSSNFPPLIVRPSLGPSIGLVYVYTSTHVSIKTVYNVCVRVWGGLLNNSPIVCDRETENERVCQIINIWQTLNILRDLLGLKKGFSRFCCSKNFFHNWTFKPRRWPFDNYSSHHTSTMPTCSELHAESKVGTPTYRWKVKRKHSLLVQCVQGVHDLGSLGKLWLLFVLGGGGLESGWGLWRTGFPLPGLSCYFHPGFSGLSWLNVSAALT